MKRLSSNLTIFLKIFIPIFYGIFFGSFLLASFFVDQNDAPLLYNPLFKLGYGISFLCFIVLLYFTFMKLKRVDASATHVYVGNYLKTYKYPYEDIECIKIRSYGILKTMRIYFKGKTTFGKKVSFLPSTVLVEDFVKDNLDFGALIQDA